ncbi:MFS transporter [Alphaproteobacteria bacterium GH1-50]|uniref:MFS transporter n=1 Tax=Kangsaoukella pontilimi TaxID=2691042 RepID=A0A7C9N0Y6_9RHOB|nr:MFS transporter [Kangsaoukella pontilimi]MXQ08398.1 MFS transporter [Kangsaoukella pontilimi]
MTSAKTPPHIGTLILIVAMATLSLNMFLPALAHVAEDLGTDYGTISIAVAGYLGVTAFIQLMAGALSDRFGRRPVMLVAIIIFVLASLGALLAQDVVTFLVFRMFQSAVSVGHAISLAVVRDTTPAREATAKMGTISMVMAVAPMIGPTLGGVLDQFLGWRAIFGSYVILGLALFVLAWIDLGETRPRTTSQAPRPPVLRLLKSVQFWAFALCTAFSVGAFFIFVSAVPLVATERYGLSSALVGMGVGSITAGFMAGAAITRQVGARFPITLMMRLGRTLACLGLLAGLLIAMAEPASPLFLFGATIFVGFGNGLSIPGSNTGAMSIEPALAGTASGIAGALVVGMGGVLTYAAGLTIEASPTPATLIGLMLAATAASLATAFIAKEPAGELPVGPEAAAQAGRRA